MVEQVQRLVVRATEAEATGPRLLFTLALTTATLLIFGVGGSVIASGHLPQTLSTMISISLMAGIVVANSVQIAWETTRSGVISEK